MLMPLRFSLWYLNNFIKYANVSESLQSSSVGFLCFYVSLLTAGYLCFRHWVWPFHVHHPVKSSQLSYSISFCFTEKEAESLTFSPLELDGNQGCIPQAGLLSASFYNTGNCVILFHSLLTDQLIYPGYLHALKYQLKHVINNKIPVTLKHERWIGGYVNSISIKLMLENKKKN